MAEMGRYCKAYLASDFAKYEGWKPELENLRQPEQEKPDQEPEKRTELADDDILYLQESLTVTDGIFLDENVLFSDDSDGWKRFCEDTLEFAVPEDVLAIGAEEASEEEAAGEETGESAEA
jgi:hypothetical protein